MTFGKILNDYKYPKRPFGGLVKVRPQEDLRMTKMGSINTPNVRYASVSTPPL